MSFQIIPAIDIRGGQCVRLLQGDYARETFYGANPLEMARRFEAQGAPRLHVVDLDGAREGRPVNIEIIRKIAGTLQIPVQVGGGIRTHETLDILLDAGVQRCIIGTAAAKNPDWAEETFAIYADAVILGIDAKNGQVAVEGWQQTSGTDALSFAKFMEGAGALRIIFTDIARDGTLTGPNLQALQKMANTLSIPLIASGGVHVASDVTALQQIENIEGVIIGKAFYEGTTNLQELLTAI